MAGTDVWPKTPEQVHGRLVGYQYRDSGSEPLSYSADRDYKMREARQLKDEDPDWKEGPHDLAPVPGQRKILLATDLDVYEFDLDTRQFSYDIGDTYFKGFATSTDRQSLGIPRSGLKSLSLSPTGNEYVYIVNDWKRSFAEKVRFFNRDSQELDEPVDLTTDAYKARWFCELPGWPTAN